MDEKNELSDIVLNKSNSSNPNKKIILAIATLGIVLIVVVMLMNSINSKGTDNLPQAVLPPEPQTQASAEKEIDKEPLFEDVPIVQENQKETSLDHIAKKLKEESTQAAIETEEEPVMTPVVSQHKQPKPHKPKVTHTTVKKAVSKHAYFVQVGSFQKYKPNKKFLHSITALGYRYTYKNMHGIHKVLVGPFTSRSEANKAKAMLRKKVVSGAFVVKL